MGRKGREQGQDGAEEAREEKGVLNPLVDRLHGGDVTLVGLRRQTGIYRHGVGVEDPGDEASGKGGAGQREGTDGREKGFGSRNPGTYGFDGRARHVRLLVSSLPAITRAGL